jgi:potassium efflux system protein
VGLLSELPGETLAKLGQQMRRENVAPGAAVVHEGDEGDRFYVVLSGVLGVSQAAMGPRRVLRPGDYFGEVALAMGVPRTASVRALTPAVVASCDQETFDEYVRPLFADDAAS